MTAAGAEPFRTLAEALVAGHDWAADNLALMYGQGRPAPMVVREAKMRVVADHDPCLKREP